MAKKEILSVGSEKKTIDNVYFLAKKLKFICLNVVKAKKRKINLRQQINTYTFEIKIAHLQIIVTHFIDGLKFASIFFRFSRKTISPIENIAQNVPLVGMGSKHSSTATNARSFSPCMVRGE